MIQSLKNISLIMTIIYLIVAIIVILALSYAYYKNRQLKADAMECAKEAALFQEKLRQLSDPSHLFTDDELVQLKKEFEPLRRTVNYLYDSSFISTNYLRKLGLNEFLEKRQLLNHIQMTNNQNYRAQHP